VLSTLQIVNATGDTHDQVPALDTRAVSSLSGVPLSTLNYWVAKGLCSPTVLGSAGHRYERYWAPKDLLAVQVIKSLRGAGCSMQKVRLVGRLLEKHWEIGLTGKTLLYDGRDVMIVDEDRDAILSAIKEPGQAVFKSTVMFVRVPLGVWARTAIREAQRHLVDPKAILAARRQVARKRSARRPLSLLKK